MTDCLFCKMVAKEIQPDIVYEDELCMAFRDISPQAPTHLVFIPKKEIPTLNDVQKDDQNLMGHMMTLVPKIAEEAGIAESGYRVVINTNGDGGQEVPHIHLHILGGRQLKWPPG